MEPFEKRIIGILKRGVLKVVVILPSSIAAGVSQVPDHLMLALSAFRWSCFLSQGMENCVARPSGVCRMEKGETLGLPKARPDLHRFWQVLKAWNLPTLLLQWELSSLSTAKMQLSLWAASSNWISQFGSPNSTHKSWKAVGYSSTYILPNSRFDLHSSRHLLLARYDISSSRFRCIFLTMQSEVSQSVKVALGPMTTLPLSRALLSHKHCQ